MRLLITISLCLIVGLILANNHRPFISKQRKQIATPFFQNGQIYNYEFDLQISTSFIEQNPQQQKAMTRMKASAEITIFGKSNQLCLKKIKIGQRNEEEPIASNILPINFFETKMIPMDKLNLCCHFSYSNGAIGIKFHPQDLAWSKNIKRGVIQMVKLDKLCCRICIERQQLWCLQELHMSIKECHDLACVTCGSECGGDEASICPGCSMCQSLHLNQTLIGAICL